MTNEQVLIEKLKELPDSDKAKVEEYVDQLKKAHESTQNKPRRPPPGSMKDLFVIGPDFDAPIDGFEDYM